MNVRRGHLSYTYGKRNDFRETYGMTHLWVDEGDTSDIPIICLKHFVTEALKRSEVERGKAGRGTASFVELESERGSRRSSVLRSKWLRRSCYGLYKYGNHLTPGLTEVRFDAALLTSLLKRSLGEA